MQRSICDDGQRRKESVSPTAKGDLICAVRFPKKSVVYHTNFIANEKMGEIYEGEPLISNTGLFPSS